MEELKTGFFVKIVVTGKPSAPLFYRLAASEPFVYETGTGDTAEFSSTVSAGAESGFKNVDNLEPSIHPPRLYYITMGVRDACKYYIKIPTGASRLGVDEKLDVGFITNEKSPYFKHNSLFAFWLVHDYYPSVNAINPGPAAVTPKVYFQGMKYDIEEIKDADILLKLKNFEKGASPSLPSTIVTIGGTII